MARKIYTALGIKKCAQAVRAHWFIENNLRAVFRSCRRAAGCGKLSKSHWEKERIETHMKPQLSQRSSDENPETVTDNTE
jgi:hypothetical protein